eukprot:snap_masked-scaffold669_size115232-processed-gene-0.13 protein:Tk11215 transcript:snap_masked-scaffold669_size115232-processed-gene-0.13-mRNA-1 annotation:"PREDICTED: uncharacterized protein LOC662397"
MFYRGFTLPPSGTMPSIVAEVSEAERTSKDDIQQLILLGGYLFSGDYGGNITKWTLDLKCVKQWRAHEYQVYCLVGDESHLISSSSNGEIKKWNSETGDLIHTEIMKNRYDEDSATEVKSLHVKDGLLYAGDDKGTGHDMIVNAIVFHGSQVVTAGWDGRVKLWNTRDLAEVAQIELGFYVNALCSLSIPDQIV